MTLNVMKRRMVILGAIGESSHQFNITLVNGVMNEKSYKRVIR